MDGTNIQHVLKTSPDSKIDRGIITKITGLFKENCPTKDKDYHFFSNFYEAGQARRLQAGNLSLA
jgi:hypothetical protein